MTRQQQDTVFPREAETSSRLTPNGGKLQFNAVDIKGLKQVLMADVNYQKRATSYRHALLPTPILPPLYPPLHEGILPPWIAWPSHTVSDVSTRTMSSNSSLLDERDMVIMGKEEELVSPPTTPMLSPASSVSSFEAPVKGNGVGEKDVFRVVDWF
jgi:hypothetical protein